MLLEIVNMENVFFFSSNLILRKMLLLFSPMVDGLYNGTVSVWCLGSLISKLYNNLFNLLRFRSRLPGLPFEYWNIESLVTIAFKIGKPLMVDECSSNLERERFVRIYIEIDLQKTLERRGMDWLARQWFSFFQICFYENILVLCLACGCLGHIVASCSSSAFVRAHNDQGLSSCGRQATYSDPSPNPIQLPEVGPWLRV